MIKNQACPICRSSNLNLLFQRKKRKFFACLNCRLNFVHPLPDEDEIRKYYQAGYWRQQSYRGKNSLGYLSYLAEKESLLNYFQKTLNRLKKLYPNLSDRVLDIGCSFGFFLKVAQKAGWKIYGIDLSPIPVKEANRELGVKTIVNKNLNQAKFETNFFDLVTAFQTIEHLGKPGLFLKEVHRILKPGGLILVTTPDAGSGQTKLMGKAWFSYRHLEHLYFFNFRSLSSLLEKSGFVKIKRLANPIRLLPLNYLLTNFKFYSQNKSLVGLTKFVRKVIGPLGSIKVPLPLASLVLVAEKA